MAMNDLNIPTGEIVASYIDTSVLDLAAEQRKNALIEYLGNGNPKGQAEIEKELSDFRWQVKGNGNEVAFSYELNNDIPFVENLKDGTRAVAGGDGGIAHNPDNSTYHSEVDPKFWGNELSELSIDAQNVMDDILKTCELLSPDGVKNGMAKANSEIAEAAAPYIFEELSQNIGGAST